MIIRMKEAYDSSQLLKGISFFLLCATIGVLGWLGGGFPPWSWRMLIQTTPDAMRLWQEYGWAFARPFGGVLLLSGALVLGWLTSVLMIGRVTIHWLEYRREQQAFADDLSAAELLAEEQLQEIEAPQSVSLPVTSPMTMRTSDLEQIQQVAWHPTAPRQSSTATLPAAEQAAKTYGSAQRSSVGQFMHVAELVKQKERIEPDTDELEELIEHPTIRMSASQKTRELSPLTALRLQVGVGLDPGLVRKDSPNEDTVLAVQGSRSRGQQTVPIGLFVVADGMGGHANGQEASRLATQVMSDVLVPVVMRSSDEGEDFSELLKEAVHKANLEIYKRNHQRKVQEHEDKMGTTLTAALVIEKKAYIVNVGDSRVYLYRPRETIKQVTRDHSVVARLVENGLVRPEDMRLHPYRNQIYRCLGDQAAVEIDSFEVPLEEGDTLLLCSDGVWEMVDDHSIENCLQYTWPKASQMSSVLVQEALHQGGGDNIGLVVMVLNQEIVEEAPMPKQENFLL